MTAITNDANGNKSKAESTEKSTKVQLPAKELSEEDKQLVETLKMLVDRIVEQGVTEDLKMAAMNALREQIKSSTSSITSIPKAPKYLPPH